MVAWKHADDEKADHVPVPLAAVVGEKKSRRLERTNAEYAVPTHVRLADRHLAVTTPSLLCMYLVVVEGTAAPS
jgi:hypothetical protein